MKINGRLIAFTLILVILATACKFFFGPSLAWSGFSPVIAIALFSGLIIKQRDLSFLLPLIALVVSDAAIQLLYEMNLFPYAGFYEGQVRNYLLLLAATLVGWALNGKKMSHLIAGAVLAPTFFYLLSNLTVWIWQDITYPKNFGGLMTCYAAALPFYKNALMGTIIFLPVILACYNLLTKRKPELTLSKYHAEAFQLRLMSFADFY